VFVCGWVCVCVFVKHVKSPACKRVRVHVRVHACVCVRVCVHAFDFFKEITCISMCMYVCLCV